MNNEYVVTSDNLKEYAEKVNQLIAKFYLFTLEKIDRNKNNVVDRLAKNGSGETSNDIAVDIEL